MATPPSRAHQINSSIAKCPGDPGRDILVLEFKPPFNTLKGPKLKIRYWDNVAHVLGFRTLYHNPLATGLPQRSRAVCKNIQIFLNSDRGKIHVFDPNSSEINSGW